MELYKEYYGEEKYDEVMKFFEKDEWKALDREQLNSDRRYYETRKDHKYDPDQKIIEQNSKCSDYRKPQPFELRLEEKLTDGFGDVFDDKLLAECMNELSQSQYKTVKMIIKNRYSVSETAEMFFTSERNVQKLFQRGIANIKTLYVVHSVIRYRSNDKNQGNTAQSRRLRFAYYEKHEFATLRDFRNMQKTYCAVLPLLPLIVKMLLLSCAGA